MTATTIIRTADGGVYLSDETVERRAFDAAVAVLRRDRAMGRFGDTASAALAAARFLSAATRLGYNDIFDIVDSIVREAVESETMRAEFIASLSADTLARIG